MKTRKERSDMKDFETMMDADVVRHFSKDIFVVIAKTGRE